MDPVASGPGIFGLIIRLWQLFYPKKDRLPQLLIYSDHFIPSILKDEKAPEDMKVTFQGRETSNHIKLKFTVGNSGTGSITGISKYLNLKLSEDYELIAHGEAMVSIEGRMVEISVLADKSIEIKFNLLNAGEFFTFELEVLHVSDKTLDQLFTNPFIFTIEAIDLPPKFKVNPIKIFNPNNPLYYLTTLIDSYGNILSAVLRFFLGYFIYLHIMIIILMLLILFAVPDFNIFRSGFYDNFDLIRLLFLIIFVFKSILLIIILIGLMVEEFKKRIRKKKQFTQLK